MHRYWLVDDIRIYGESKGSGIHNQKFIEEVEEYVKRGVKYYEITEKEKKILLEKLREALSNIENILVAIVYGGFTRRNFFRDVDIAVYTGGLVQDPLRFESELCLELSKIAGVQVDVRIVDEAPAWFKMKILKDGLVVYEKTPGAYTLYVKETVGEFQDIKIKQKYSTKTL